MSRASIAEQHAGLLPPAPPERAGYMNYLRASCAHAMALMLRRMRVVMAAMVCLMPVVIPLAIAFLGSGEYAEDGAEHFRRLVEHAHITVLAPLLALFFASMLIGEDVEGQTISYILTRPTPRSAWVFGKFLAYLIVTGSILLISIVLTYAACTTLTGFSINTITLGILMQYGFVALLALLGNGAVATFIGALSKRPIVFGVLVLYGWQQLATRVPGLLEFFTIQKYVQSMLPPLAAEQNAATRMVVIEFQRKVFLVGATKAGLALVAISLCFIGLSILVVRMRQYASSRAVGA